MLLTALATFLVLAGCEVLLFASVQSSLTGSSGPVGNIIYVLLLFVVPVFNLFASWYAGRRICVWLWPDMVAEAEEQPARRRLARQQQF